MCTCLQFRLMSNVLPHTAHLFLSHCYTCIQRVKSGHELDHAVHITDAKHIVAESTAFFAQSSAYTCTKICCAQYKCQTHFHTEHSYFWPKISSAENPKGSENCLNTYTQTISIPVPRYIGPLEPRSDSHLAWWGWGTDGGQIIHQSRPVTVP